MSDSPWFVYELKPGIFWGRKTPIPGAKVFERREPIPDGLKLKVSPAVVLEKPNGEVTVIVGESTA